MRLYLTLAAMTVLILPSCTLTELADVKIAYNVKYADSTDNYEIFIMNPDGSGKKNISNHPGIDWVYYAYGNKLYFVSDRDTTYRKYFLYEMDSDGQNVRRLTPFLVKDSWFGTRKNGKEWVVASRKDGAHRFYIIDENGNELRSLGHDTCRINDPVFSPDEKQIVFRSNKTGIDELWIMNDNGTDPRQITFYPKEDTTAPWHAYHAGPPVWRPRHNEISFQSKQKSNYSIFTIRPDGSGLKQITPDEANEGWHSWSPDGEWLTFDRSDSEDKDFDIYIMKYDGTGLKKLTNEFKREQSPVFVRINP